MKILDHDRSADHTSFTTLAVPFGFKILTVGHFKFIFLLKTKKNVIDYILLQIMQEGGVVLEGTGHGIIGAHFSKMTPNFGFLVA